MGHLHRAGILVEHVRGLQPHYLMLALSRSGQAAAIGISHNPGIDH
jgi:hypothetical protein